MPGSAENATVRPRAAPEVRRHQGAVAEQQRQVRGGESRPDRYRTSEPRRGARGPPKLRRGSTRSFDGGDGGAAPAGVRPRVEGDGGLGQGDLRREPRVRVQYGARGQRGELRGGRRARNLLHGREHAGERARLRPDGVCGVRGRARGPVLREAGGGDPRGGGDRAEIPGGDAAGTRGVSRPLRHGVHDRGLGRRWPRRRRSPGAGPEGPRAALLAGAGRQGQAAVARRQN
mmetsp:Transcript_3001/g.8660  ORF Transcript_3001/g.8660 Transcript_3001/m.8660 type:complete len:231 (+) Transcript_3001:217-909(+)